MEQPAGAPAAQPQQAKSKLPWIIGGCCGCALLAIVFFMVVGGSAFFIAAKATEPAKIDARAFLSDMEKGDVDAAFEHFTPGLQADLPKERLKANLAAKPEMYQLGGDPSYTSFKYENDVITLEGSYPTKSGGRVACKFTYVQQGGAWKMNAINLTP